MDISIDTPKARQAPTSVTSLEYSARAWFIVAALGQIAFALYIAALYGGAVANGDLMGWNRVMRRGYTPGDTLGNVSIAFHLLLAFTLTVGGIIQVVPQLRSRAPSLHRWNGRAFMVGAIVAALTGLYLLWVRGTVGDTAQHLGTSLNAIMILVCAFIAWNYARERNFAAHRRWALRLFLVVSGVWFFRVGLMAWLLVFQQPVGFNPKTFTGPFLTFLTFAQTLIPLALLELYFRAQSRDVSQAFRVGVAALLVIATLITALGVVGATMGLWWPRM